VPGVLNDGSGFQFGERRFRLYEGDRPEDFVVAEDRSVSSGYFDLLRVPLVAGEDCRRSPPLPADGATTDVVVNQSFVARLGGRAPLGLTFPAGDGGGATRIVGVVGDARDFGLGREPVPTAYACQPFAAYPALAILVRASGDPMALAGTIRQRLKEIQPGRSVYDVRTLDDRISGEYVQDRLRTILLVMFGGAALALVCLGIYGTLSYIVSLRRREVGLRVALGAQQANIVKQFLVKAMRVVAVACAAGLVLAFAVGRSLSGMLFGVSPSDPATLAAVVSIVIAVAALAAFLPALRASRIDPMEALRDE
jgi:hypothetical protein